MYLKIKWWQLVFYEIAVLSFGVIIATYWHLIFRDYLYIFIFLFVTCGAYTAYLFAKQIEIVDDEFEDKSEE